MFAINYYGIEIAIISITLAIITSALNKLLVNKDRMDEIQERSKKIQTEINDATKEKNDKKVTELNAEFMKLMSEQMKMSFKPTIYTFIPFLLIITWMQSEYGKIGFVATEIPILGNLEWFGWYFVLVLAVSLPMEMIYSRYRKHKKSKKA